jgi:hypothetical protein
MTKDGGHGRGRATPVEANIAVAEQQGRIRPDEKAKWRAEYERRPYEAVTRDLLSRKATANAKAGPASASEAAIVDYLHRTHAIPSWRWGAR